MGIFGDLFGPSQKEREESYAKGVEAAKEGGLMNSLLYGDGLTPDSFLDERYKSERAGYRDYTTGNAPDWADDDDDEKDK